MAAKALWARRAADKSRRSAEFEVPNTLAE
jgi:hypothetical protein